MKPDPLVIDRPGLRNRHPSSAAHEVPSLAGRLDLAEVGAKAHTLSRILDLGVAVPAGVVIKRQVFEGWLDAAGLRPEIDRLTVTVDRSDVHALRAASFAVRTLVLQTPLPKGTAAVLDGIAIDMLPLAPLVVRSSAVGEDGGSASFAGQLDSILNVGTPAEFQQAVLTCWASYWSERVLSYRQARGVALDGMGVIVQRQVDAVEAGVLFTRHPSGDPECMLVESCAGLADKLVSGEVEPRQRTIARGEAGGDELARTAVRLEGAFGGPQDIEWARDSQGKLWIVQSRPITTARAPQAAPAAAPVLWSNANVCENFPGPICPLLYSIASVGYYHYFRNLGLAFGFARPLIRSMDRPMRTIIGVHGARMYYNLTNIHAILRLAPFGEHLAAAFNQFVGAQDLASPPPNDARTPGVWQPVGKVLAVARIAICTAWQFLFLRRRVEAFERTADAFVAGTSPEVLAERSLTALAADLDAFMNIRCHRWKNASLADAASMIFYSLLQRTLVSAGAHPAMHNRLLRALPGVPSSLPPVRLWALSRRIRADEKLRWLFETTPASAIHARLIQEPAFAGFRRELDRYLAEWGFRSSAELMLTMPSLQEEPEPLLELLKQYATIDGDAPEIGIARQAAERVAETRQLFRRLVRRSPLKAAAVWSVLRATQSAIGFRERARHKQAQLYARCRRIALEIGRRLVTANVLRTRDDVFLLTYPEIEELAAGRAMSAGGVAEMVVLRRRQHAQLARSTPPDRLVLPEGASFQPDPTGGAGAEPATKGPGGALQILTGTGACGGRVTAPAAVLADVNEAGKLRRGDVLITRQTDPGWAPVFCLIRGLVIERGGMLSHGAIIAREFGLPCVVGVAQASILIQHGDSITVDGDAGVCTVERGSPERVGS